MAILMVFDHDRVHVDAEKDQRGSWKRGYVVQVFDDSQKLVLPPAQPFLFVKVVGAPVDDFESWATEAETEPQVVDVSLPEDEESTYEVRDVPVRRRAYLLDLDTLPQVNKDELATARYTEL